jgi:hypothetical protein
MKLNQHSRQKADENQQRHADCGAENKRGDPVQEGTLRFKRSIHYISCRVPYNSRRTLPSQSLDEQLLI